MTLPRPILSVCAIAARELDQLVKSDGEDSELFSQILGEMEVDSFDDLVSLVNDEMKMKMKMIMMT